MKTHIENIGHEPITQRRAMAATGDPRAVQASTKGNADHRVILKSKPYADNKRKQQTYYFKEC